MLPGERFLEVAREFRDAAVLQLGHPRQIAGAVRFLKFRPGVFQLFLEVGRALHDRLLRGPDFLQIREFALQMLDLRLQALKPAPGSFVRFLLQRFPLDLQLDQAPLQPVQVLGLGIDFHANPRSRLVHEVDRLVRQLPIGDITVRQRSGGDDGGIGDLHAVMHLVALLQAAKNRDGVLHRGLVHPHLLEAPLKRRILLHVLAVFVQGCGADAVQLPSGQGRFQHVAGVHGALRLAGADHVVQLVDEENDLALLPGKLVEHRLQTLLELAAKLGARNQRAEIQGENSL